MRCECQALLSFALAVWLCSGPSRDMESSSKLVAASEVERHNSTDDAWIVVDGQVYDMTRFAPEHPGGAASESARRPAALI